MLPLKAVVASQVRYLNLHEYQSKQLMAKHNINVQRFAIAETVEQAENAALGLSTCGVWEGCSRVSLALYMCVLSNPYALGKNYPHFSLSCPQHSSGAVTFEFHAR